MAAQLILIGQQSYVGKVLNRQEIAARGAIANFADYIVSPKAPYHFKPGTSAYKARGQHESQDDTAQKVFALMWGNGLKKGMTYGLPADIIDLIPTAAAASGVGAPANATGQVLTGALVGGSYPVTP